MKTTRPNRQEWLVVPSLGRPTLQPTIIALNAAGLTPTLVVQPQEERQYQRSLDVGIYRAHLLVLPAKIKTIAPTRQYILDLAPGNGKVIMLDDDLGFSTRQDDGKYTRSHPSDVTTALATLMRLLSQYTHGGVASRQGVNYGYEDTNFIGGIGSVQHCTRMQRVLGYNVRNVRKAKATFTRVEPLSDFDMTLQLLRAGHENVVLYDWCQDEITGGFQAAGGCSTWRTLERLRQAQKKLMALHPDYITAVERTYADRPNRTELRIQWKQAYRATLVQEPR